MKNKESENRISLTGRLARTSTILIVALVAVWVLFYINIRAVLDRYVVRSMNRVSEKIISELNEEFLEMENLAFAMDSEPRVIEFIKETDPVKYMEKAGAISAQISKNSFRGDMVEHLIIYGNDGKYYRFEGNLSNTSVKKLIVNTADIDGDSAVKMRLENAEYIGYLSAIHDGKRKAGTMVILIEENTLLRFFNQTSDDEEMKIALCTNSEVIISQKEDYLGKNAESIVNDIKYCTHERIGFTPFEFLITYEDAGNELRRWFIVSMVVLSLFMMGFIGVFIRFWRKKFFDPIQNVISDVEKIEAGESQVVSDTGLEHFDGLVNGINEMIERIEEKENEIFETQYSLKETEIRKQKALIVSLKKQISAHFTVNVLNVIKALATTGENEKAGNLCDGLSYLLRYANAGDSYISVMEEFFVLQRYVDIMGIRYPDKFSVDIDVEDELEEIRIPRMLLQPILENSILHGVINNERPGVVHLFCKFDKDIVQFIVEDNGRGMSEDDLLMLREKIEKADETDEIEGLSHVALSNIQRRIISYYGKEYGITVDSVLGEGTTVTVKLPV